MKKIKVTAILLACLFMFSACANAPIFRGFFGGSNGGRCPECGSEDHITHTGGGNGCFVCGSIQHTSANHPICEVCGSKDHETHPSCPTCGSYNHTVHPVQRCAVCGSTLHKTHPQEQPEAEQPKQEQPEQEQPTQDPAPEQPKQDPAPAPTPATEQPKQEKPEAVHPSQEPVWCPVCGSTAHTVHPEDGPTI